MIDFWNIESHLYIFWQPTVLFHDQKRNPQLMSSFSMFHFILIVQCVTSGFIYCTLFKFCFEVRNPISFCFGLDFFSSYCALHYAIKMLGKHKLMYLTHRRYGVLWGPSRAGVIHQKISVKAFTTTRCPVWCLTAYSASSETNSSDWERSPWPQPAEHSITWALSPCRSQLSIQILVFGL